MWSSIVVTVKVTDDWPAGIVTVGGTLALVGSLLDRLTTSGAMVEVFRVSVAVVEAPLFTATVAKFNDSPGPLALSTVRIALAAPWVSTTPASVSTLAAITAVWLPSSSPLLITVIGKLADVCPAPITTFAGTVAAPVLLLDRLMVIGSAAGLEIDTVAVVAGFWAASLTVVWARVRLSMGMLSSMTVALAAALTKPEDEAEIVAASLPSISLSSTTVTGNVTDVWPAGMVTVAGTDSFFMLLLARDTTSAAAVEVLRVTVPVVAGLTASSLSEPLLRTRVRVGTLTSVTVRVAVPETRPVAAAVSIAVWVPTKKPGLMVPTAKLTDVCPAGMVTVCGTVALPLFELVSVTSSGLLVPVFRETVAVVALAPAPSLTVGFASVSLRLPATAVGCDEIAMLLAVSVS